MNDMVRFLANCISLIRGLINICVSVVCQMLEIQVLMA